MGLSRINIPKSLVNIKRSIEDDLKFEDVETVPKNADCDKLVFTYDIASQLYRNNPTEYKLSIDDLRAQSFGSVQLSSVDAYQILKFPRTHGFWRMKGIRCRFETNAAGRAALVGNVFEVRLDGVRAVPPLGSCVMTRWRAHWQISAQAGEGLELIGFAPASIGTSPILAAGVRDDTFPRAQWSDSTLDFRYDEEVMLNWYLWSAAYTNGSMPNPDPANLETSWIFESFGDR